MTKLQGVRGKGRILPADSDRQKLVLSIENVVSLHDWLISNFGGLPGIHDKNLLMSSLERPFTGTADGHMYYPSLLDKAACLLQSLIQFHPFNDGNKRTGIIMTGLYLLECGYNIQFVFNSDKIVQFSVGIAEKRFSTSEIKQWIQEHMLERKEE